VRRMALALALLLPACGGVRPLSVGDPRLPADARRDVADAEDAVVAARARAADAEADWHAAAAFAERAADAGSRLGAAASALNQLATARLTLADAGLAVANAEQALAEARLTETYAETAMRHDLAVYELAPLNAEVESKRTEAAHLREAAQQQREALETTTQAWWTAWRQYTAGGGDSRPLWRELEP